MSKTIFGTVNADGTINSGKGFKVVHDDTGEYSILYNSDFQQQPAVVVTQNHPSWNDFTSDGGKTTDNATVIASDKGRVKIKTGNGDGNARDRNFNFICVGD